MSSDKTVQKKRPYPYFIFFTLVLVVWLIYVSQNNLFYLIEKHIFAVITMVFGAFIAGSSPEGSAAIAYPVFTLILDIKPDVARNFAFAIQSIGMSAASLLILGLRLKVEWKYILYVTIGGLFGLVLGTIYIVPLISPILAKLFFVSLWLSFGTVLYFSNRNKEKVVFNEISNFNRNDIFILLIFGLIGGVISSVFGTGINIFTFCLMTTYYKINEKVAVPSSIIIMTIETIFGLFVHAKYLNDMQAQAIEMWIACIPFVIIFAPLGSFIMSKMPRLFIANFLTLILIIQFGGAFWVIKPNNTQLAMCIITLLSGLVLFYFISTKIRKGNNT